MVDPSIAQVHIDVVDINDNPPHFEKDTFYAGNYFFHPPRVLELTLRSILRCGLQFKQRQIPAADSGFRSG